MARCIPEGAKDIPIRYLNLIDSTEYRQWKAVKEALNLPPRYHVYLRAILPKLRDCDYLSHHGYGNFTKFDHLHLDLILGTETNLKNIQLMNSFIP